MLDSNNKLYIDELINEHTKFTLNDMRGDQELGDVPSGYKSG